MTQQLLAHAGSVNLWCLPCDAHAPVLPPAGGPRAATYPRRLGWRRQPWLGWCCPACVERLVSGNLGADVVMAALQRDAAERLFALLDQP